MPKFPKRRKTRENPFDYPKRDYTSDLEEELSNTSSLIQAKNINLLPKMDLNANSAIFTPSIIKITTLTELVSIKDEAIPSIF